MNEDIRKHFEKEFRARNKRRFSERGERMIELTYEWVKDDATGYMKPKITVATTDKMFGVVYL